MPEEESSSLGLQWHIKQDVFSVKVVLKDRKKTKAGVLGHIGAVFDPLGIVAPAKLILRLINREIDPRKEEEDPHCIKALDWYDPLPAAFDKQWDKLVETCKEIAESDIRIKRPLYPQGHGMPVHQQIHAFADASDIALAFVSYLRTVMEDGTIHVAFIKGNTRVPDKGMSVKGQISIPRLELNAARDLAKDILEIEHELDIPDLQPTI